MSNKYPEETYKMYIAMKELSDICQEFGVIIDGGKDSLSVAVKYNEILLMSWNFSFNIICMLSRYWNESNTWAKRLVINYIYWFSDNEMNMGGSILSSKIGQLYTEPVYFENLNY